MIRTVCMNFMLKKTKILANGKAPIYLRITVAGERLEFTTKRYVLPARWNAATQRMTGTNEEARIFNLYLKTLEQEVFEAHRQLLDAKININAEAIKDKLLGKEKEVEVKMLVPIFEEHNKRIAALIGRDYAAGTLERYATSLKHTIEFLKWQYKVSDIDIKKIDHEFISAYDFFLRS